MIKIPAQHAVKNPPGQHCSAPLGKTIDEWKEEWLNSSSTKVAPDVEKEKKKENE